LLFSSLSRVPILILKVLILYIQFYMRIILHDFLWLWNFLIHILEKNWLKFSGIGSWELHICTRDDNIKKWEKLPWWRVPVFWVLKKGLHGRACNRGGKRKWYIGWKIWRKEKLSRLRHNCKGDIKIHLK
jgi:hypothetical protein